MASSSITLQYPKFFETLEGGFDDVYAMAKERKLSVQKTGPAKFTFSGNSAAVELLREYVNQRQHATIVA